MEKKRKHNIIFGIFLILAICLQIVVFADFDDTNHIISGRLIHYEQKEGQLLNITLHQLRINRTYQVYEANGWNLDKWIGEEIQLYLHEDVEKQAFKINEIVIDPNVEE